MLKKLLHLILSTRPFFRVKDAFACDYLNSTIYNNQKLTRQKWQYKL